MDIYSYIVISMFIGYIIGSIPFALIIGKVFYKVDVRKFGSGNLGATNVARTLGWFAGFLVLLLDALKGGLPGLIMYKIAEHGLIKNGFENQLCYLSIIYCVTGFFSCIGHCHPLFANFKGGKAVASMCGFIVFMNYRLFIAGLIAFVICIILFRIVSIGSLIAAFTITICSFFEFFRKSYLFTHDELHTKLSLFIYLLTIIFLFLLLLYRHLDNITRLLKHEEHKFKIDKVKKTND